MSWIYNVFYTIGIHLSISNLYNMWNTDVQDVFFGTSGEQIMIYEWLVYQLDFGTCYLCPPTILIGQMTVEFVCC